MKTLILFSLALVFAANAAPAPAPVLDLRGKYLQTGAKYYVTPVVSDDEHGGLFPVNYTAAVAQSRDYYNLGLPLTFSPVNPKKGVIRLSTDVNIKFSDSTGWDIESNVWKVKYDKALKQYAVMVGGVEGNPGPETLDNWFKIEKTNDGYKFVFCPSVCSYCKVMCKDVGTVIDKDGWRRLVLSGDPMSFEFWSTN
ncbi:putative proteinase inhibitor I3, Kunitz legume, kunitz inhibitor STI-like superfamily [Helianthus annuus]|uniref:Uncharacterized protein n=1 Tax=Helianthus annuus TaxID=4232 RepID=A0A251U3D9_HELAN|nr:miraculin [Helianthus annuus]KAF5793892.1 putative proteinase inhibitor I3, Kunitz legume, kunitz inhibitor STI-like superfamily [Helianthus annuus]KAJ0537625.1 putative proteinase inhibitor I3, Kunitz legume, kunitz inhibitor STI-like superfamily [Helianthus annuus]KAJ0545219.1 putative proteinase inhibitor I3, Kunitz legume, kunitz inhibitor STI-like superfamily [Helianthus annuus]KAJ0552206.1 putative proteinase inhibitor I3, Kunitz legume, kunitz inhibitor STI-like superfamily [Helianthu